MIPGADGTTCNYWLAHEKDGKIVLDDGCHPGPEGVATAAKLLGRIFGTQQDWLMVTVQKLPEGIDPEINEEDADLCAALVQGRLP